MNVDIKVSIAEVKKLIVERYKLRTDLDSEFLVEVDGEEIHEDECGRIVLRFEGVERKNLQIDYYDKVYYLKSIEMGLKIKFLEEEKGLRELEFICL